MYEPNWRTDLHKYRLDYLNHQAIFCFSDLFSQIRCFSSDAYIIQHEGHIAV